ncbi:heavy metal translocating P-type ATPase [Aerococcaceae bacterium NML160702]|nr:heavy metal translocating P-type ATPase [Aerococcaceae bacterium NML160702]
MTMTIISGVLIIIGMLLEHQQLNSLAYAIFIVAFIIGGYHSAKEGLTALFVERQLNVDILMLLATIGAGIIGYWLEGALLIFIFSLSESLEVMAMNKSYNAIASLMSLTPEVARRYQANGAIEEVATERLRVGDRVQVRKGEAVPIDGTLLSERAIINEAALTGEPLPVEKIIGDALIGGTINQAESIDMTVSVENENTLFAKVIRMVKEAQSSPSHTASLIAKIENTYVKIVLLAVPLFILGVYFLAGWTFTEAFYRGMVLLTVASPCALIASATPATLAAISRAAGNGILFKGGSSLDNTTRVKAIVFDKTGTLTEGKPSVAQAYYRREELAPQIDAVVKSVELHSTHPIAAALVHYLRDVSTVSVADMQDLTGYGMVVNALEGEWQIGKASFVLPKAPLDSTEQATVQALESQGMTLVYVAYNQELVACYALSDQLKKDSHMTIQALKTMGIRTIMLTGDRERTAHYIANQLGIDEVRANCLPADKATVIKELQAQYGEVAMVGDGVNDAPALALATVGIAMGSGTDIAMETADVVLMQDDLMQIPFSIRLSKRTQRIVLQNITFSLVVIACLITANVFQLINLPLGVIGHEGSTILVILNGLRLLMAKE